MNPEANKVVHVSTVHPLKDTRIFLKQCRSLKNAGYNVKLIIQAPENQVVDGIEILALTLPANRFERMTKTFFRAAKLALSEKAGLYHLHDPELILLGLVLKLTGRKVVYDMHENLPAQILNKEWIPFLVRKPLSVFVRLFERLVLNSFTVIFAEHSYAADYGWVKNKEVILNLPLVEALAELRLPLEDRGKDDLFRVGYIGVVTLNRGIGVVVEAVKSVREKYSNVIFECVGPVSMEVEKLTDFQIGVNEGWINTYGRLAPEQGWPIIARCDVGVALLKPIGNYIGSYPTKMFEYMALGLPLIVSDFELYKKIVNECQCGYAIDPEDCDKFSAAISELVSSKEVGDRMALRGAKEVEMKFSWRHEFEKLLDVYRRLLD